jgi:hypothetical protein
MVRPPPTFVGLEGLLELGRRDDLDIRPTLLRVLTDLYLQKDNHAAEDESYFTELALRLIEAVEVPVRLTLARRLATYPSAPPEVVRRLARDVIEVAEPILRASSALTAGELDAIARDCGPRHAAIVAERGQRASRSSATVIPSFGKPESSELCELFFGADPEDRREILLNLDYAALPVREPGPSAPMSDLWRLETAALQRNCEGLARDVERLLDISIHHARRIVTDPSGEPIVVVAKALKMPADILQRILLFLNPNIGQSIDRVYQLSALYDELTQASALHLVAIWRDASPREAAPAPLPPQLSRTARDAVATRTRLRHAPDSSYGPLRRENMVTGRGERMATDRS